MAIYWEAIHDRGLQTCAVWGEHNEDFQIGQLTLTAHDADVGNIMTLAAVFDAKEDLCDQARDLRDQNYAFMRKLNVRAAGVISGNLEEGDLLALELEDVVGMRNDSTGAVLARARKLFILWTKVNTARAAAEPALDPIQVGESYLAVTLDSAVAAHENLLKGVQTTLSASITARNTLRKHVNQVDKNNKRFYEAWGSNYEAGSVEHDALSQIDTGPGNTPLPGVTTFEVMYDAENDRFHIDAEAEHGTEFREFRKGPGEDVFVERGLARSSPMLDGVTLPGEYFIELQATNSTGDGPRSASHTITVPE